ncbi:MAG: hypothetical protein ABR567_22995 [Myxococcales bacterium]
MHAALLLLAAGAPALVDASGARFELAAEAAWPAAALVDAAGAVTGAMQLIAVKQSSDEEPLGLPRLDVFDVRGVRRIIVRPDRGPDKRMGPLVIFLDAWGKPRLRLRPGEVEMLNEAGKVVNRADADVLKLVAGERERASAQRGDEGTRVRLLEGAEERASLSTGESGWHLTAGDLLLRDSMHGEPGPDRPHVGSLYGTTVPPGSRYTFIDGTGKSRPAPSERWTAKGIEFDTGGVTTMKIEKGKDGTVLTLLHTR